MLHRALLSIEISRFDPLPVVEYSMARTPLYEVPM